MTKATFTSKLSIMTSERGARVCLEVGRESSDA